MLGTLNSLLSKVHSLTFRQWIQFLLGGVLLLTLAIVIGSQTTWFDPMPILVLLLLILLCIPIAAVLTICKWLVINYSALRQKYGSTQAIVMLLVFIIVVAGYIAVNIWVSLYFTEEGLMPQGTHLKVITVIAASTFAYFPVLLITHPLLKKFIR